MNKNDKEEKKKLNTYILLIVIMWVYVVMSIFLFAVKIVGNAIAPGLFSMPILDIYFFTFSSICTVLFIGIVNPNFFKKVPSKKTINK